MGKAQRAHHFCVHPWNWWARPIGLCPSYLFRLNLGLRDLSRVGKKFIQQDTYPVHRDRNRYQ